MQEEAEEERALKLSVRGAENPVHTSLHAFGLIGEKSFSCW